MNSKTFNLGDIPFLNGLPESDLKELASVALTKEVEPGQVLIKSGETPAYLMFVLEGRLQSHETANDGRIIGLGAFSVGDAIGWLTLIDGLPMLATINALSASTLLLVPMSVAQRLVLTRPLVIERLLKLFAAYIRQSMNEKAMLSLPNAFHRVFVLVNQLSTDTPCGQPLDQLPKQHELANIVNTSRETVSRALQQLVKAGVLGKVGHQIVIKEADTLKKLAADGPDALPTKE